MGCRLFSSCKKKVKKRRKKHFSGKKEQMAKVSVLIRLNNAWPLWHAENQIPTHSLALVFCRLAIWPTIKKLSFWYWTHVSKSIWDNKIKCCCHCSGFFARISHHRISFLFHGDPLPIRADVFTAFFSRCHLMHWLFNFMPFLGRLTLSQPDTTIFTPSDHHLWFMLFFCGNILFRSDCHNFLLLRFTHEWFSRVDCIFSNV